MTTWDTIQGSNDANGLYYVDYYGVLAFEVNTSVVKDVPQSWSDLLKAEYKGQIALPGDPRASNEAAQTVYAAAINNGGTLDNVQPGLDFFKQMNQLGNLLPLIADPGVIAKGETPISIHWNYLALADQQTDNGNPNIQVVYPTGTAWGGYYYQAISAYAPHPAAARLWEEYLYSDEGQNTLIKGFCTPARMADMLSRDVVSAAAQAALPPASMLSAAVIPSPDQLNTARALSKLSGTPWSAWISSPATSFIAFSTSFFMAWSGFHHPGHANPKSSWLKLLVKTVSPKVSSRSRLGFISAKLDRRPSVFLVHPGLSHPAIDQSFHRRIPGSTGELHAGQYRRF